MLQGICDSEAMTFVDGPFGTLIRIGTFTARICDFVILFESVNVSAFDFLCFANGSSSAFLVHTGERGSK